MKKLAIVLAAAWLVAACSVKEDVKPVVSFEAPVFTASLENSTRAYLNGNKVCWELGYDEISIFNKNDENLCYEYSGEDGATSGTFTLASGEDPQGGTALNYVYASFPYDLYNSAEEGGLYVWLAPEEYLISGTFTQCPMVAVSEDENLAFKNVCGFLCVPLYGTDGDVASVTVVGNDSEIISGDIYVSVAPGDDPVSQVGVTSYQYNYAKIIRPSGYEIALGSDSIYAIVTLPPMTFNSGITVTVIASDGREFVKTTSNPLTIQRNVCKLTEAVEVVYPALVEDPVAKKAIEDNLAGTYTLVTHDGDGSYSDSWEISYNLTVNGNVLIAGTLCEVDVEINATFDPESNTLTIAPEAPAGSYYGYDLFITFADDESYLTTIPLTFSLSGDHVLTFNNPDGYYINLIFYYNSAWRYLGDMFIDQITHAPLAKTAPKKVKHNGSVSSNVVTGRAAAMKKASLPVSLGEGKIM